MGGLCSCFRGSYNQENGQAASVESVSGQGTSPHCFQFLYAYNVLFQRRHVRLVSSVPQGRATIVPSPSNDNSISDTYRPPPRPLPYDDPRCSLLLPQSQITESMQHKVSSLCHETFEHGRSSKVDGATKVKKSDCDGGSEKVLSEFSEEQPTKQTRSSFAYSFSQAEDEDVCPTCLEEERRVRTLYDRSSAEWDWRKGSSGVAEKNRRWERRSAPRVERRRRAAIGAEVEGSNRACMPRRQQCSRLLPLRRLLPPMRLVVGSGTLLQTRAEERKRRGGRE